MPAVPERLKVRAVGSVNWRVIVTSGSLRVVVDAATRWRVMTRVRRLANEAVPARASRSVGMTDHLVHRHPGDGDLGEAHLRGGAGALVVVGGGVDGDAQRAELPAGEVHHLAGRVHVRRPQGDRLAVRLRRRSG